MYLGRDWSDLRFLYTLTPASPISESSRLETPLCQVYDPETISKSSFNASYRGKRVIRKSGYGE